MRELTPRIIIADDEKDICDILKRLVQQEGYKAFTAHDGESALKMVRSELPDVLLTDFQMPGIDGMELLNKVKEVDPDLPVIMITAYADISGREIAAHSDIAPRRKTDPGPAFDWLRLYDGLSTS